jgi:hypothetical protein
METANANLPHQSHPIPQGATSTSTTATHPTVRKFQNGWTKEQEKLMAKWSDIATCYRWLHDRSEKHYKRYNIWMTIPVIILSTLTGTANFGIDSFLSTEADRKYASIVIGGLSLVAGMLTTLANFFRYAQLMEAHRVAAISWGKFQRQVAIELSLHPNDRIFCMDFLKMCRNELDRMIEQAPQIPDEVIDDFESTFGKFKDIKKPDICNSIEPTHIFVDTDSRLKQIATEASLMIQHKKRALKEMIVDDLEGQVLKDVDAKFQERLDEQRQFYEEERRQYEEKRRAEDEERWKQTEENEKNRKNDTTLSTDLESRFREHVGMRTPRITALSPRSALLSAIPDTPVETQNIQSSHGNRNITINSPNDTIIMIDKDDIKR